MVALFGLLVLTLVLPAMPGTAAAGTCGPLDGKYEVKKHSWVKGVQAPGIQIVSASGRSVVFAVDETHALDALCVQTGKTLNGYQSDTTLPARGPATITL